MAKQTFTTGSVLTATQMNNLQANDYNWTVNQKTTSYVLVASDAGTRIEMNSGSATTVTVNTGIFAAGDTLFIQNIGSGVCTVTAGTATVNRAASASLALAQWQGGYLYFISASSAVFFADAGYTPPLTTKGDLFTFDTANTRLPIGTTNNHVLMVDSTAATGMKWASVPSSSKSYQLVTSGTLSGSSTSVTGLSGVDNLMIIIGEAKSSTTGVALRITFNSDSGNNYYQDGARYLSPTTYSAQNISATGTIGATGSVNTGNIFVTSNNAASEGYANIQVLGANSSGGVKAYTAAGSALGAGGVNQESFIIGGAYVGTAVVSSIQFICQGGTWNNGHYRIYGAA